jgi:hypothetical protein
MSERRDGPDDRRRQKIHHVHPIPDKDTHPVKYRLLQLRWRLALWSVVYPVQIALIVALAILAIPVTMLLNAQADLRKAQRDIEAGQRASQRNQVEIQRSRVAVTKDICAQLDRNARTSNAQLKLFQGIIVNGARQGQIFNKLYREFGAPPYRTRLKQAKKTARAIEHLKLPLPNCTKAVYKINSAVPTHRKPPPEPPH